MSHMNLTSLLVKSPRTTKHCMNLERIMANIQYTLNCMYNKSLKGKKRDKTRDIKKGYINSLYKEIKKFI